MFCNDLHGKRILIGLHISICIIDSLYCTAGTSDKEPACQSKRGKRCGLISGLERSPGEGNDNPLQCSCLENPKDRSLVGYSPGGHKESDMTDTT